MSRFGGSAARRRWSRLLLLGALSLLIDACGVSGAATGAGGSNSRVEVVAAENFWGSIASQVGGDHVHVTSVIVNPNTDPHAYEAKPDDAKTTARAQYVIANGAGYDSWVPKLLAANPVSGRKVFTVADKLGKKEGDNPHFWYNPDYVNQVVDQITADLKQLDSADSSYFDHQNSQFKNVALKDYNDTISQVKRKYSGTNVGASESIFAYLSPALGLNLVTPAEYMKAISEGTDPSAQDKATIGRQILQKQIKLFVFNSQNTAPDVNAFVQQARARRIPVSAVTETLAPQTASFQEWQTAQLKSLLQALGG